MSNELRTIRSRERDLLESIDAHLLALFVLGVSCATAACTEQQVASVEVVDPKLRETLLDPETCRSCHPGHYDEWAGSMHAYAADDPVFIAMNRRGQEETGGQLGTFCVNCHAPMAVREGLTRDGLNLDDLPREVKGVTCYFCHNVESIQGDHNNPLVLANDTVMRGPFDDAQETSAHGSRYAPEMDAHRPESARLCGACHDVVLEPSIGASGFHLERTYAEWQATLFNKPVAEGGVTCNGCHMPLSPERDTSVNASNAPRRATRRHDFEGIDLAITEFPGRERQRVLVEQFLAASLLAEICVSEAGVIRLTLENVGSGHNFPSGAAHDREIWLELAAYRAGDPEPVFATGTPGEQSDAEPAVNRPVVLLRDHAIDAHGDPAHMFWEIAGLRGSTTISGAITRDPLDPAFHAERKSFEFDAEQAELGSIDRVTLRVRVRPIALDVLRDLVDSGHLEPRFVEEMPVIDVLPDRCPDPDLVERYPGLVRSRHDCDPSQPERQFTLVWERALAEATHSRSRRAAIRGTPASCYAHPTYVALPPLPQ